MRKFLRSMLAVSMLTGALAGCGTSNSTVVSGLDTVTSTFIADVQAAAADACKVIPTVAAITSIFNASIGATVASITSAVCAVAPQAASAKFKALPVAQTGAKPVALGTTPQGIVVTGWRAGGAIKFGHVIR